MKPYFFLFFLYVLSLTACKSKKVVEHYQDDLVLVEQKKQSATDDFSIASLDNIQKEDLMYQLKDIQLKNDSIIFDVSYSGGCVRPHEFELVTDGVILANGQLHFYLLHKTHDDYCKALLMEQRSFNLQRIFELKSEKLSQLVVNGKYILTTEKE